jgi:hypothetical protein
MNEMEHAAAIPKPGRESPGSEQLPVAQASESSNQNANDEQLMNLAMALAQALQKLTSKPES